MLLAIDAGNSNITFGIFNKKRLLEKRTFSTGAVSSFSGCRAQIYNLPYRTEIEDIIISSVVPDTLPQLERALKRILKREALVLGRDVEAPIKNLYMRPEQVGQDRLANAAAASAIYNKGADSYVVVIDFGTAVTFDLISKKNEYLGGLIFPGIRLSLENLSKRAALLPRIEIKNPRSLIGRDTKDSMRSGLLNGYGSLCDGIIERIRARYRKRPRVVATGGDAGLIARYSGSINKVDPNLTLKGLQITYSLRKAPPV